MDLYQSITVITKILDKLNINPDINIPNRYRRHFDKGIQISINRLLNDMAGIKHTFFCDINKPEKVQSFTLGSENGEL